MRNPLSRAANYSFTITILWLGFVVAIGFVETPLRFLPERISLDEALSIGRLVFHALNISELVFASLLVFAGVLNWQGWRRSSQLLAIVIGLLLVQTGMLFTVLDARTEAILRGEAVPEASYHFWYIAGDVAKVILLVLLAVAQIRELEESERV